MVDGVQGRCADAEGLGRAELFVVETLTLGVYLEQPGIVDELHVASVEVDFEVGAELGGQGVDFGG